jgi:hypothetical protein
VLCLPILLAAVAASADPFAHQFDKGTEAAGIPFELNSNKIYLSVKLADGKPRWFILDSGCPVTAVDTAVAAELKLPLRNERQVGGVGEARTTLADATIDKLTLPGLTLQPGDGWAIGVNDPVSPFEGRRIDGLLGLDFLERFVVRIDYPKRALDVLSPKGYAPPKGAVVVPLDKVGAHYAAKGTLRLTGGKEVEGTFMFDIGVRLPLLLNTPFVDKHELVTATGAGPLRTVGGGLGGEAKAHIGRVESLTVGKLTVDAPLVALSRAKRGAQGDDATQGILGAEVFRRYRLTLDLPNQRAVFEETADTKTPYEFDASGLFLTAAGDDLRTPTVRSVVADSPAAAAGVQVGDVIVQVDGKAADKLTLDEVRAGLREHGATRVLTLKRGGKELTARVALKRPA